MIKHTERRRVMPAVKNLKTRIKNVFVGSDFSQQE